jgi:hypothetical protein
MGFVIRRRHDHRYMKGFWEWVLERDRAFDFPDRDGAVGFCSEHKLTGVDVVQCGENPKDDVVVHSVR